MKRLNFLHIFTTSMPIKPKQKNSEGFVLLLTLVVVSIVLAIGLSMLQITMKQLTLSNIARESEIAFHAASTGIECMQYYRGLPSTREVLLNEDEDTSDASPPILPCGDLVALTSEANHDIDVGNDEYIYNYQYRYQLPSGQCLETSMYLVDGRDASSDITTTVSEGLEEISCETGSVCTTIFSRGYNRGCGDIGSIFTVQRELTIEY